MIRETGLYEGACWSDRLCRQAFTDYVGIAPDRSELTFSYLMPGEESWSSSDDRWIACLVGERPPAPPLLGSVRGTKK